jgi:hypothetical protein
MHVSISYSMRLRQSVWDTLTDTHIWFYITKLTEEETDGSLIGGRIVFMMLMCQLKLTIDVAPCFVLRANRSLV